MKLVIFAIILGLAVCSNLKKEIIVNEETEAKLERIHKTWETMPAKENPFYGWTEEEIKKIMGTKLDSSEVDAEIAKVSSVFEVSTLPENFDGRDKFKACVHPIRNQLSCGSCWAFAGSEMLSDRFCIKNKDVILSPQDMVSCDGGDMGCNGGNLPTLFSYLEKTGIVEETCFPYTSGNGSNGTCPAKGFSLFWCHLKTFFKKGACPVCPGKGASASWTKYKCASGSTKHLVGTEAIKSEIMTNGPVETGFTVYSDFMHYKSGVYSPTSTQVMGGHAVKIIGWGIESSINYWLVANSWGPTWGMTGFFKIKMGVCGFDDSVYTCNPKI